MAPIEAQLDHVVLLLPYKDILDPPAWLTKHLTISPGGRHADNKTENRLVLFADGTYLELIAFIDDDQQKRSGHWWDKPFGVVDFAFTTQDENFPELQGIKDRLSQTSTGISYQAPQEGGRHRPDGIELKWRVTFAVNCQRGESPFWCHDVTPRERRVPCTDQSTTHPSGVLGMAGVELKTTSQDRLNTATAAILDRSDLKNRSEYGVGVPHNVPTVKKPTIRIHPAADGRDLSLTLVLQTTQKLAPIHQQIGDGTVSIVFEPPN